MFEQCAVVGQNSPCVTYGQWGVILLGVIALMAVVISVISWVSANKERDRIDPDHTHTILW